MVASLDHRWAGRRKSEVMPQIRGDSMTCTGIRSNGAGIGIIPNCRAGPTRTCTRPRKAQAPECAGEAVGRTRAGLADRPFDCDLSRNDAMITLDFEWWRSR